MKARFLAAALLLAWLTNLQVLSASVIDDSRPNPMLIGKAFGFMLFGNDGFMKPGIENLAVNECVVSFETDGGLYSSAIQRIYIRYDLNKANWRSAVYRPDYAKDLVWFDIFGEKGLREIRYDHTFETDEELQLAVAFLGLTVGPQNDIKIQLPNYMTQKRYDRAFLDLTEQCPGSQGSY